MVRDTLFDAVRAAFSVEPEYLWASDPNYAVFRHPGSRKWFAVLVDIPASRLGLPGDGIIDVLLMRTGAALTGSLLSQEGFYPAYHMNKTTWVAAPLSGPLPREELMALLTLCYDAVAPKRKPKSQKL